MSTIQGVGERVRDGGAEERGSTTNGIEIFNA